MKIRDPTGYRSLITGKMSNENDDVRQKWPAEVDIYSLLVQATTEVIMKAF